MINYYRKDSMKNYLIGIDGGGTKSHLAIFDQNGQLVTIGKYGPLNHEVMEGSFTQLEKELSSFIENTLASVDAKVTDVAFAVMGIAGVDTKNQHAIVSAIVERIGFKKYILCNDAFLGVSAGCPGGVGICAINGTGSSMAAVDHSKTTVQVGGLDNLSNDCGGGSWFGTRLLAAVYEELFKCEAKTMMTEMVFDWFGIRDADEFVEKIANIDEDKAMMYELNIMTFKAAAANDPVAISILQKSADHYAGGITYLAKTLDFPVDKTLHITLAGSVFAKEKTHVLPDLLAALVAKRLPGRAIEFHKLTTVPVAGAVYWAGKEAGYKIEMETITKSLSEAGLM